MPRRGKGKHCVLGAGGGVRWEICEHNTICWITVQTLQGFCRLPRTHSCRATRQNSAVLSDTMAHHWSTKGPRGVLAVAAAAAAYFKFWIFNRVTWRRRVLSHARSAHSRRSSILQHKHDSCCRCCSLVRRRSPASSRKHRQTHRERERQRERERAGSIGSSAGRST